MAATDTRLAKLEGEVGQRLRPGCPPLAVGLPVGDDRLEVAGKIYSLQTVTECFSHSRYPFVILDGPDPEDVSETPHTKGQ